MIVEPFEQGTPTEAVSLLKNRGRWLIAAMETNVSWPLSLQVIRHDGCAFILRPRTKDLAANLLLDTHAHSLSDTEAVSRLFAFCSALTWAEGEPLVARHWMFQNIPMGMGLGSGRVAIEALPWSSLPTPRNSTEREVLALYREAISSTNPFYAALTYYKIIERLVPGKQRGDWLDSAWPRLDQDRAIRRYNQLRTDHLDVGKYVQESVRKAIAHTNYQPFANPDEATDLIRISADSPLMNNLAMICISDHCAPQTATANSQPDLGGFLAKQTDDFRRVARDEAHASTIPELSVDLDESYTLVVRRGVRTESVKQLSVATADLDAGGRLFVLLTAPTGAHAIEVIIEFADPDIHFVHKVNPGFKVTRESVVEHIQIFKASCLHALNGQVELWSNDVCVAKGKPFLPVNALFDHRWAETTSLRLGDMLLGFDTI